jgi:putative signal transducing protein
VYCPQCGIEYRDGFNECSDCGVPLVVEKPPERRGPGDPNLELVTVLEGSDRLLLATAKGLLDNEGIPYAVSGEEIPGVGLVFPGWRVQVALDRAEEARTTLHAVIRADA